ncbi:TPA: helix-turn-helix transcriptional regulator [Vibrio cholerae]|nr:helix-turn-helix transcriptional regulator [Vibrio cholerae]
MTPKVLQLRELANKVEANLHSALEEMLHQVEVSSQRPISSYSMYDLDTLTQDMREKKKMITLEDLELQTGISSSTIKRMLKNPRNTSLENFLDVANELGMKIWIEK